MLFQHMRTFIFDLRMDWEEAMWRASPERKELATQRLAAHILSIKEGRVSPYVDPDAYTGNWTSKTKLR